MTNRDEELLEQLGQLAQRRDERSVEIPQRTPEQSAAIADRVLEALNGKNRATSEAPRLRVVSRSTRSWIAWGAPLCAAAALLLVLFTRGGSPALPEYGLEVTGSAAVERGPVTREDHTGPLLARLGAATTLVLRPKTFTSIAVDARVFLQAAGSLTPLPAQVTKGETGALRVRFEIPASVSDSSHLVVLVGKQALLQQRDIELANGKASQGRDFQRWSLALTVTE
jgi:hypothetical protein